MASKRRKVEVHRLTISGLAKEASYAEFLTRLRDQFASREDATREERSKSHVLWDCRRQEDERVRLQFVSFSKGFRPDIIDTTQYTLAGTPLADSQTGVDWTHCLGGTAGGHFLLLVEKHQAGIFPRSIENYLNWLIGESDFDLQAEADDGFPRIVVSLEAEPGEAFMSRLDALTRIRAATYRVVRPNPGWTDLEGELNIQSEESNAHKVDVLMTAVRMGTLSAFRGIVGAIKKSFQAGTLDYAKIEGEHEGKKHAFNTSQLAKHSYLNFEIDSHGQVRHDDAWDKLNEFFDGNA